MGFLNGWNKNTVKKVIDTLYKGRASFDQGGCYYLISDGRKCGVGIFIPDGHEAQTSGFTVKALLRDFPDLKELMPLSVNDLANVQDLHDNWPHFRFSKVEEQKEMLYKLMLRLAGYENE